MSPHLDMRHDYMDMSLEESQRMPKIEKEKSQPTKGKFASKFKKKM